MFSGIELIEFGRDDIENIIARMSPNEIDRLAFGAIQLDAAGTILQYNAAEGEIAGLEPHAVIGKNFFNDIAPCTNTLTFRGVFDAGVKAGALKTIIEYVFNANMKATRVRVHMKKSFVGEKYWIFVQRI